MQHKVLKVSKLSLREIFYKLDVSEASISIGHKDDKLIFCRRDRRSRLYSLFDCSYYVHFRIELFRGMFFWLVYSDRGKVGVFGTGIAKATDYK